jgi:PleD family two-component response regulator
VEERDPGLHGPHVSAEAERAVEHETEREDVPIAEESSREDLLAVPLGCRDPLAVLAQETASSELIARADRALYRAKAEGKNRVRLG